jgi:hypothetical protein
LVVDSVVEDSAADLVVDWEAEEELEEAFSEGLFFLLRTKCSLVKIRKPLYFK